MILFFKSMQNLISDILNSKIEKEFLPTAAQNLNVNNTQAKSMIETALPFVMGALAKNTANPQGAAALENTLKKHDHASFLNNIGDVVKNPDAAQGGAILQHLFGGKTKQVEQLMAKNAGASTGQADQLLKSLAPMVMGALGKANSEQGLNANALSGMLQMTAKGMGNSNVSMNVVTSFLDSDGDGKIHDDIFSMLFRMIKGIFSKKA